MKLEMTNSLFSQKSSRAIRIINHAGGPGVSRVGGWLGSMVICARDSRKSFSLNALRMARIASLSPLASVLPTYGVGKSLVVSDL